MSYIKTDFVNGVGPAFSADEANKIGAGIEDAHDMVENTTSGHKHDGVDSRKVSYGDLTDKPKDRNTVVMAFKGQLAAGTDVLDFDLEAVEAMEIVEVRARLQTASTDGSITLDVKYGEPGSETSIWDDGPNRLVIAQGQKTASTVTIDNPNVPKGSRLQLDVDSVPTTPGSTLTLYVIYLADLEEAA